LGWQPEVSFEQLVALMVDADVAALSKTVSQGLENSKRAA
jgi:hypothetical protein